MQKVNIQHLMGARKICVFHRKSILRIFILHSENCTFTVLCCIQVHYGSLWFITFLHGWFEYFTLFDI